MKFKKDHPRHKGILKKRGWSYRSAAPELGVNYSHLSQVLNGTRRSVALLERIENLPENKEVAR